MDNHSDGIGKKNEEPIFVTKSFLPPFDEYVKEIESIWETHILTNNGPKHRMLADSLKAYLSVPNLTLFVNGHLALEGAIKALELHGEIITTPFTFASTTHAIANTGCTPVFCDIKKSDFTIDETKIESLITPRTVAILPVHVFGFPCNTVAIEEIAKRHGLKVIYDAAHVFGVKIGEASIGSFGDISMFSFHATKVFHSVEGGALSYGDAGLSRKLDLLKNFGISGPDRIEIVGFNAKMNEFQAAMGLVCLRYIESEIEKRRQKVTLYRRLLRGVPGLYTCDDLKDVRPNYAYFPVLFDPDAFGSSRDTVCDALAERNIFARKYFHPLTSDCARYAKAPGASATPIARYCSANIVTLPLWSEIPDNVVSEICEVILALHCKV